ncbi:MAG: ABC transporter ATP-binding protein [Armatimonadetes bacterium]|nr:ABC transporter ATP-binding protein [Armatimonadota bacterium]
MTTPAGDLVLQRLTKAYPLPDGGALTILHELDLTVPAGETVAIVGPSGSGKSTLLNLIGTLDQPTSGTIHLGQTEVTSLRGQSLAEFRARALGFVFQDHHLLPQLTAIENVLVPTLASRPTADANARASALLDRVGLSERRDSFPSRLSGGERQRVAIARALINRPQLLLADEPTGNLDLDTGASVISLLLELAADQGATVMMVTHNPEQAARCQRTLRLREGRLVPQGAPA